MLDQIRRDIQARLDELLGEIDRLRWALTALTSRESEPERSGRAAPAGSAAGESVAKRFASGPADTQSLSGAAALGADARQLSRCPGSRADRAGRDQGRDPRRAARRQRDDRRRDRGRHRTCPRDGQHNPLKARGVRGDHQSRARLPDQARERFPCRRRRRQRLADWHPRSTRRSRRAHGRGEQARSIPGRVRATLLTRWGQLACPFPYESARRRAGGPPHPGRRALLQRGCGSAVGDGLVLGATPGRGPCQLRVVGHPQLNPLEPGPAREELELVDGGARPAPFLRSPPSPPTPSGPGGTQPARRGRPGRGGEHPPPARPRDVGPLGSRRPADRRSLRHTAP